MILTDVGGYVYAQAEAAATLTITPLFDRAAFVRRINLSNPSAADNWTVNVGGRELLRFRELTVGNQSLLRVSDSSTAPKLDFWEYCRNILGIDPSVPVPNGQSLIFSSVGGATGDIDIEFEEVSIADANVRGINHYLGNVFLAPITWFLNAAQSAAAAVQFDTQISPAWFPALFSNTALPVNWKVELLSLFLEGMGVNTFSGAANHQSSTRDLRVTRDGVQMFTRASLGIPLRGSDSAAGSANTVFGQRGGIFRPFVFQMPSDDAKPPLPIVLNGGDVLQLFVDLIGDLTGAASYANAMQVAIARVTVPVGQTGS